MFSEGAIPMIDAEDKPARTMLTSVGLFSRTTHIVKDKKTDRIRLLTAKKQNESKDSLQVIHSFVMWMVKLLRCQLISVDS